MNTLEFIDQLIKDGHATTMDAKQAHNLFVETVGEVDAGTYGYFRTKFNNKKKSIGIITTATAPAPAATTGELPPLEIPEPVIPEVPLAVRKVVNYNDKDTVLDTMGLIPTGTIFDEVASDRITTEKQREEYRSKMGEDMPDDEINIGGFTRKCADIVAGPAGSGKTYSRCILAAKAKRFARLELDQEIRVGFISGEMRKSEWDKEVADCSSGLLKELEVEFMLNYVGFPNYEEIFWEAVGDYDIVIVDSLPAILSHFKMSWDTTIMGKMPTETQMIFQFIRKILESVEVNDNNVQVINQANKDGNYKGGTELPHMLSSMSFVRISPDGSRYMFYDKNRNSGGTCKRKLFFNKKEDGDIEFNVEAYNATYKKVNDKKQDIGAFMSALDKSQQDKLNSMGESSATEASPEEMGTGGATAEERAELDQMVEDFIPYHLREEPTSEHTTSEGQLDLEDNIAIVEFEERQRKLDELQASGEKAGGGIYISSSYNRSRGMDDDEAMALAIWDGRMEGDREAAKATLNQNKTWAKVGRKEGETSNSNNEE